MVTRLVGVDPATGKLPDVVLDNLNNRYNQRVIDTQYPSLEEALAATPTGGTLEVRSTWSRAIPFVVGKPCSVLFRGGGSITTTTNSTTIQVAADDVRIDAPRLAGTGSASAGIGVAVSVGAYKRTEITRAKVTGYNKYGFYLEGATDFVLQSNDVSDIAYGGIMMVSCATGVVQGNRVRNITQPAGFLNSYGIAATRDSSKTITASPRSSQILITNNVVDGVPKWEGIDTHAGTEITISYNTVRNTNVGIALVPGVGIDGNDLYGAQNCIVTCNVIDSTMSDGSRSSGIQVVGAGVTLGSPIEASTGCSVTNNTIRRHGKEAGGANDGAIALYYTSGIIVAQNSLIESGVRGIHLYHDNQHGTITGNTFIDTWSDTVAYTAAVHVSSTFNSMSLSGNTVARGSKTATKVNDRGLFVGTSASNTISEGFNDFDTCTTPVADTGNVSTLRLRSKKVGAYGVTPVEQQTVSGAIGDGTALKSLLTALAAEGWIKNTTTS